MSDLKSGFISHLRKHHPSLAELPAERMSDLVSDNLLCEHVVRLPKASLERIQDIVRDFDTIRSRLIATDALKAEKERLGLINPGHRSIMMSFDFHMTAEGEPRLIEINTNAAFHLLNFEMLKFRGLSSAVPSFNPELFKNDVLEEMRGYHKQGGQFDPDKGVPPHVVITDEDPAAQRMYVEFLLAQDWFRSFGWSAEVRDFRDVMSGKKPDFVYNRCTDFYLQTPAGQVLKNAINSGQACVAPNPHEYLLMADKERLIEWTRPGALEALGLEPAVIASALKTMPLCLDFATNSADDIWARRKTLFFKPKREFGSKRAFRGSSVSRKVFDEIAGPDTMAQEFIPAPEVTFNTPDGEQTFKYDLRCYSYGDRLEGVVARVYQGQVTNLKTPHGGFAAVAFE